MEILLLAALIVLNGVFAMSEIALVMAKRARLARLAEQGDTSAAMAVKLHDDPTRFLSTVQVGITSIGILNGIVGEAALAGPLALWLQSIGMETEASRIASTALVVIIITYVTIVIGELVPKRIGQIDPERIARRVARPMNLLALLARPFVRLLSVSTDAILRLLGKQQSSQQGVIEEEIHALLQEGSESGAIEQQEREMVRNVFRLDDRPVESLMTPRADIVYLDTTLPLEENLRRVAESEHARFPVCQDGLDEVLGILNTKQLLDVMLAGASPSLTASLLPAVFVPESLSGLDLLEQFRASDTHLVLIIDEYGEINGLVTLRDVLEAVTGEFKPRNLEEAWAVQREDGSWLLDGLIPIPELKDRLGLKSVPEEDKGRYHTLSGLVMWLSGRLPQTGDVMSWESWRLEVVDLDGKRIDKVLASPIPPVEASHQDAPAGPA
ncbi:MAG: hemolysin family protein [Rhodoferax sp.]|uniref:hemolysin family protein n=1 Tax=Rhodoferax sp. TaxID=50421 RepID=UPI002731B895|nr:hemolysin family protein [Rhodoferax sp.]MDP1529230.1 hemolysin family protein [Rhodoferax sp.]MDP2057480.1 hemolysin family protein [Thiobacillus sp.]